MSDQVLDKAYAEVDRRSGRAAIVEPDGKKYIVDVTHSRELQDGTNVYMGMFLQPAMTNLEFREAGEYPYTELISYIELAYKQESCLQMFLMSLDRNLTTDLRKRTTEMALELMSDPAVKDWLIKRLTDTPLPKEHADITGLPNGELKQFVLGLL